ncbi:MAG TPA: hypothetical protein VN802_18930 [Stellaceae bacterium]|nr:hypothetical protein [Stellaceae bacterium]
MIAEILGAARRFDEAVQTRVGRPYQMVLGAGLVIEIVRRLRELGEVAHSNAGIVGIALTILLYTLLLIHQLGELHEHAARRRGKPA